MFHFFLEFFNISFTASNNVGPSRAMCLRISSCSLTSNHYQYDINAWNKQIRIFWWKPKIWTDHKFLEGSKKCAQFINEQLSIQKICTNQKFWWKPKFSKVAPFLSWKRPWKLFIKTWFQIALNEHTNFNTSFTNGKKQKN